MYAWIVHNGFEPVIIATKLDKINRSQRDKHIKMVRQGLKAKADTKIIPFSSLSKEGRDEIWANILAVLEEKNKQIELLEQSVQETEE
jgi:GTP-binding protein